MASACFDSVPFFDTSEFTCSAQSIDRSSCHGCWNTPVAQNLTLLFGFLRLSLLLLFLLYFLIVYFGSRTAFSAMDSWVWCQVGASAQLSSQLMQNINATHHMAQ
jgi:hypothetical protein